jgi:hypothetical protein
MNNNEITKEQIEAICKKIADMESENMKGGIETIGDYGFKCAMSGFNAGFRIHSNELLKNRLIKCVMWYAEHHDEGEEAKRVLEIIKEKFNESDM